jgi:hypothetical protein
MGRTLLLVRRKLETASWAWGSLEMAACSGAAEASPGKAFRPGVVIGTAGRLIYLNMAVGPDAG